MKVLALYFLIGALEWYLALQRTLCCAQQKWIRLSILVLIENLLGFFVLLNFIKDSNWLIAVVYSVGASAGALCCAKKFSKEEQNKKEKVE